MGSVFDVLIEAGAPILAGALFLILSLACEAGYRVGRLRGKSLHLTKAETDTTNVLTGGMLALLAFMLGLTVDFAQNRFEARRELVAVEANHISTAWLRARMIGGPEGDGIARLIAQYARTRLEFTRSDLRGPVDALIARTVEQHGEIWSEAAALARRAPTPITASLVSALNEMFDASLSQRFAYDGRVPADMLTLLLLGAVIAIGAMGFQMGIAGARQPVLSSLLLLMWTGGMVMTVDLNRARAGGIRVDSAPLRWTLREIEASPPAIPVPALPAR